MRFRINRRKKHTKQLDRLRENKMGNSKTKPEQSNSKESNENDTSNTTNTPNTSIYPQLQIRNCIRNVRNNNSNFSDMFPNEAGASCGS